MVEPKDILVGTQEWGFGRTQVIIVGRDSVMSWTRNTHKQTYMSRGTDGHDSRGCGHGTYVKTLKVK